MATTTNYGWDTPDDTDLVKDGASAIRTLGSSIDTTTKNLNPETTLGDLAYRSATANVKTRLALGTAGQVLRVNSGGNAPEWATTADQTPLTTKGDLFTFSTVDARLGVGANGTVLTADSAEATGLKWAAPAGGGKVLQVVSGVYDTQVAINSSTYTDTGLNLSITPTSATSKILIIALQQHYFNRASAVTVSLRLVRVSTEIENFPTVGRGLDENALTTTLVYLDSPATTSSTNYKVQGLITNTASSEYIAQYSSGNSTITLLEIGA